MLTCRWLSASGRRSLPLTLTEVAQHDAPFAIAVSSTGSAQRYCPCHARHRRKNAKPHDLVDNFHGHLLKSRCELIAKGEYTDTDVASEHEEEQKRVTQQRWAQPVALVKFYHIRSRSKFLDVVTQLVTQPIAPML